MDLWATAAAQEKKANGSTGTREESNFEWTVPSNEHLGGGTTGLTQHRRGIESLSAYFPSSVSISSRTTHHELIILYELIPQTTSFLK